MKTETIERNRLKVILDDYSLELMLVEEEDGIKIVETSGRRNLTLKPETANMIKILGEKKESAQKNKVIQMYGDFHKKHGTYPQYAIVDIDWKGSSREEHQVIKFSGQYGDNSDDPEDDQIVFYVDTLDDILDLCDKDNRIADFFITDLAEFTDSISPEPSVYDMKCILEKNGWDWNVLDMMDGEEIRETYDQFNEQYRD